MPSFRAGPNLVRISKDLRIFQNNLQICLTLTHLWNSFMMTFSTISGWTCKRAWPSWKSMTSPLTSTLCRAHCVTSQQSPKCFPNLNWSLITSESPKFRSIIKPYLLESVSFTNSALLSWPEVSSVQSSCWKVGPCGIRIQIFYGHMWWWYHWHKNICLTA